MRGVERSLVTLSDGRSLDVVEFGDPNGPVVFFLHGTPGGPLEARSAEAAREHSVADPEGSGTSCGHRWGSPRSLSDCTPTLPGVPVAELPDPEVAPRIAGTTSITDTKR